MTRDVATRNDAGAFGVLDGVSLVAGGAIASLHLRDVVPSDPSSASALMALAMIVGIGVTASGPLIVGLHAWSAQGWVRPSRGEWVWALAGLPWIGAALARIVFGVPPQGATTMLAGTLVVWASALGFGLWIAAGEDDWEERTDVELRSASSIPSTAATIRSLDLRPTGSTAQRGEVTTTGSGHSVTWRHWIGLSVLFTAPLQFVFAFLIGDVP
ncbi:hypothetical protein Isop_0214 [Isosphaera pallida ATCC 43644]|uniref:Uncharacterized protein n=2 Tax=Isosphaera pallida TaxID=128 RepID=E8QWC4_ISOPI|nr:hypothetical protein Isop_0214 [Isosphaera pallida ATCC 43644]